ncbi:MAG TPA: DUF3795 domain-containing protein [Methanomicrobiales archaeon]|nr:DUF3795 domain-containing protein [Methanomicrobiales archaeon]
MNGSGEGHRLTAPCGLCCADCIPSRREIFDTARILKAMLEENHIEEYAALKAGKMPVFRQYGVFSEVLEALIALECPSPCREGGGKPVCRVRECVEERHLAGCWECEERTSCRTLSPLLSFHPHLAEHLEIIREKGEEQGQEQRRAHYPWE